MYKSLKKPNEDLGQDEYTDPAKYTEPPKLHELNPDPVDQNADNDHDNDEYIKPSCTTKEYFTLEPPQDGNDVNLSSELKGQDAQDRKNNTDDEETSENTREYLTLEPLASSKGQSDYMDVDLPGSEVKGQEKSSGDYVEVDLPGSEVKGHGAESEDKAQDAPVSSEKPSNDYVDVDQNASYSDDPMV